MDKKYVILGALAAFMVIVVLAFMALMYLVADVPLAVTYTPDFYINEISTTGYVVSSKYVIGDTQVNSLAAEDEWLFVSSLTNVGDLEYTSFASVDNQVAIQGEKFYARVAILSDSEGRIDVVIPVQEIMIRSYGYTKERKTSAYGSYYNAICTTAGMDYIFRRSLSLKDYAFDDVDFDVIVSGHQSEYAYNGCGCFCPYTLPCTGTYRAYYCHTDGGIKPAPFNRLKLGFSATDSGSCIMFSEWSDPLSSLDCGSQVYNSPDAGYACCPWFNRYAAGEPVAVCGNDDLFFYRFSALDSAVVNSWAGVSDAVLIDSLNRFTFKVSNRGDVYVRFSESFALAEEAARQETTTTLATTTTTLADTTTTQLGTTTTTTAATTSTTLIIVEPPDEINLPLLIVILVTFAVIFFGLAILISTRI